MLVGENLPPEKKNVRGRPPVCPNRLLAAICILMQMEGPTFRDAENAVGGRGPSREGRVPDHTTIARAFAPPDTEWLDRMVSLTADMCVDEADKAPEIGYGRFAAGGTGVETDRYGVQERPSKKGRGFQTYTRENVPEMAHSSGGGTAGDPAVQDDSRQRCGHHGVRRSARRYRTQEAAP